MTERASLVRITVSGATSGLLGVVMIACSESGTTTPTPPPVVTPTVTTVTVAGTAPVIGANAPFTATAALSNGTTQSVTTVATWQSSVAAVATVSSSGLVTGVAAGDTEIRATYQGILGFLRITLTPLPTFTLSGIVQGSNLSPVSAATVRVVDGPDAGRSTTTDNNGRWILIGLRVGTFRIEISRTGFVTITRTVSLAGDQILDSSLSVAPTCNGAAVPAIVDCLNDQGRLPPTARCADGAYSCSENRSGTCSTHGGVSCFVCPGPLC